MMEDVHRIGDPRPAARERHEAWKQDVAAQGSVACPVCGNRTRALTTTVDHVPGTAGLDVTYSHDGVVCRERI